MPIAYRVYLSDYLPLDIRHHGRLPENRYLSICIENIKIVYLINNNFFSEKLTIIYKLLQESCKCFLYYKLKKMK